MQPESAILKTLAYFDLFDYPISEEEIHFFLERPIERKTLAASLQGLTKTGCVHRLGLFYSLKNNPGLAERRLKSNQHAQKLLAIASRISRFLFLFPFVRGIGISGSLSKNCAEEGADIDYFIITKSNRLWIARTCMHLFKKLSYLNGHQDWYCMNYYIDEKALKIEEENIFTAIEMVTFLPVCGNGAMEDFLDANDWASDWFPSYRTKKETMQLSHPDSIFKKLAEFLFNNRLGDRLDDYLMNLTTRRWKEKTGKDSLNKKGDKISLHTTKHISRNDPALLQGRVLKVFNQKIQELKEKWPEHFTTEKPYLHG
ncbi:hypothetical protein ACX0G9_00700 [Flavitalea flava]